MANNGPGNFLGNVGTRLADRVAWGQNRDPNNGRLIVQPYQVVGGVVSRGLNAVAPGLGTVLNFFGNRIANRRHAGWPVMESVGRDPLALDINGAVGKPTVGTLGPVPNLGLGSAGPSGPAAPLGSQGGYGFTPGIPKPFVPWTPSSDWGAAQMAGTGDKPPSPFSAEGAYNSTNAPSTGGTSYDPTSATNQAWLFTNNMNRMNAMARDAIQKRMR